jgi:hypothetical protein
MSIKTEKTAQAVARKRERVIVAQQEEDDYNIDMFGSLETFPNGLPRVYYGYQDEIDGIPHFMNFKGEMQATLTDHRLVIEMRHKLFGHHYPARPAYIGDLSPMKMNYYNSYHRTNQDAFDSAWIEQQRLEAEGHFVPIELRD